MQNQLDNLNRAFLLIFVITVNWVFKMFAGWLIYLLATWLEFPEWAVIASVAIGVCGIKFKHKPIHR